MGFSVSNAIVQNSSYKDILTTIFSFLDALTLHKIERVCKLWKTLSANQALWSRFAHQRGEPNLTRKELVQLARIEKSLERGELKYEGDLVGHSGAVSSLHYMNGELFSVSLGHGIRVWKEDGKGNWENIEEIFPSRLLPITKVSMENGELSISLAGFRKEVWQKKNGKWTHTKSQRVRPDYKLSKEEDKTKIGDFALEGDSDSALSVTHAKTLQKQTIKTPGHTESITSILYIEGKIITGSLDGVIKIWGPKV